MSDQMWWFAWTLALVASTCDWDWRKATVVALSCLIVVYGRCREMRVGEIAARIQESYTVVDASTNQQTSAIQRVPEGGNRYE